MLKTVVKRKRAMVTRNVSLTPELDDLVKTHVATGMFGNYSDVIREALRMFWQAKQREQGERLRLAGGNGGGE